MKVAVLLTATVTFDGCDVIDGADVDPPLPAPPSPTELPEVSIVRLAAWVVTVPAEFMNTASYSSLLSVAAAINAYVPDVAPEIALHVLPPSVDTCHWMLGAGFPFAPALKVAELPTSTDSLTG